MKKILRSLSFTVAFLILLTTQGFAKPLDSNTKNNTTEFIQSTAIPDTINNFTKDKFEMLIQNVKNNPMLYGLNLDEANRLSLGQGFSVFDAKENKNSNFYYFPVLCNNKIKEILTVGLNGDGTFYATLGKDFAKNIEDISNESSAENPLVIISYKGFLGAKNKNGITLLSDVSIDGNYVEDKKFFNKILNNKEIDSKNTKVINVKSSVKTIKKKISYSENILKSSDALKALNDDYKALSVPIVNQRTPDGVQHGMCWAASVASIVNYKLHKNLTAAQVCNRMNVKYDDGANGSTARAALSIYGVQALESSSALNFDQVVNNISLDKPIYMRTIGTIAGKLVGHATVINGWIKSTDGNSLMMMDPAEECYRQVYSSGNSFYYYIGSTKMIWDATVVLL